MDKIILILILSIVITGIANAEDDITPPITTVNISGIIGTNDWYISNVSINLTATDDISGVIITEYIIDNTWKTYTDNFTIDTEGITSVGYRSIDNGGNIENTTYITIKIDETIPTINAPENIIKEAEGNLTFVDIGNPIINDTIDPNPIVTNDAPSGNNFSVGTTIVTWTVTDNAGNNASDIQSVLVIDNEPPLIILLGDNPIIIEIHSAYIDAGAIATDNVDQDITANISLNNTVNVDIIGVYTITYDVKDSSGNAAIQKTRIVNVVDTIPPVTNIYIDGIKGTDYYKSNVTVTLTATDNGSGVNYTNYKINNSGISDSINVNLINVSIVTFPEMGNWNSGGLATWVIWKYISTFLPLKINTISRDELITKLSDPKNLPDILVMADIRDINTDKLDAVRNYVNNGGKLIVTGVTAKNDEAINYQNTHRLGDVLGLKLISWWNPGNRPFVSLQIPQWYLFDKKIYDNFTYTITGEGTYIQLRGDMKGFTPIVNADPDSTIIMKLHNIIDEKDPNNIFINGTIKHNYGKGKTFFFSTGYENFQGWQEIDSTANQFKHLGMYYMFILYYSAVLDFYQDLQIPILSSAPKGKNGTVTVEMDIEGDYDKPPGPWQCGVTDPETYATQAYVDMSTIWKDNVLDNPDLGWMKGKWGFAILTRILDGGIDSDGNPKLTNNATNLINFVKQYGTIGAHSYNHLTECTDGTSVNCDTNPGTTCDGTNICISPTRSLIYIGQTEQLNVACKDNNGITIACPNLTWQSSDTSVATVSSSGLVTGKYKGSVNITAVDSSGNMTSNIASTTIRCNIRWNCRKSEIDNTFRMWQLLVDNGLASYPIWWWIPMIQLPDKFDDIKPYIDSNKTTIFWWGDVRTPFQLIPFPFFNKDIVRNKLNEFPFFIAPQAANRIKGIDKTWEPQSLYLSKYGISPILVYVWNDNEHQEIFQGNVERQLLEIKSYIDSGTLEFMDSYQFDDWWNSRSKVSFKDLTIQKDSTMFTIETPRSIEGLTIKFPNLIKNSNKKGIIKVSIDEIDCDNCFDNDKIILPLLNGGNHTIQVNLSKDIPNIFIISSEGYTEIEYYSVDNSGNIEPTRTQTINIKIPPESISGLKNITYSPTYINWTWQDPKDFDFKYVKIYLNGKFKTNISKGVQFYNATNLIPNTNYKIGTQTADNSGNINETWVNYTSQTAKDSIPPSSITELKNITYGSTYINWTWQDPKDKDLSKIMIYLNGKFKTNISKGVRFYNATKLIPNIIYEIGTHSIDTSNNINGTWINNSQRTSKDSIPPLRITNLKNITFKPTYINWTWNDSTSSDFSEVMVYINGKFKINISKGVRFYNSTNLTPNTNYKISTLTADTSGNINTTWLNKTAMTSK